MTWPGGMREAIKFAVPHRGAGVVLDGSVKSPGPEGFTLPYLPGGLRKTAVPSDVAGTDTLFPLFQTFFGARKQSQKTVFDHLRAFRFKMAPGSIFRRSGRPLGSSRGPF